MQKLTRIGSGGNFLHWSVLIFQFSVNFICLGSGSSWRRGEAAFTHSEPFLLWNEKLALAGSQEKTSCLVYQYAIKSSYFFSPFLSMFTAERQRVLLFFFFLFFLHSHPLPYFVFLHLLLLSAEKKISAEMSIIFFLQCSL